MIIRSIVLLLILLSCKQKESSKEIVQLREQLPQVEFPLKFNSDIRVKYKTIDLPDNKLIQKLNERSIHSIIGKVYETDKSITILAYTFNKFGTPVLVSFDNKGNEVSYHEIFETVSKEPDTHTTNLVTVLQNKQILFRDSTVIKIVNEVGSTDVARSDSVFVTHKKYRISDVGQIE